MAARVVIVADDLTGAMDVAGPLADRGLPTLAVASHEGCKPADLEAGTVISINADTRHLSASEAARRTHRIASELVDAGAEILIKKIDSTLRGNVVSETLAMLEATRRSTAVVAPAFPAQGRTVREGVVHVDGVPLVDTSFARDALSPPPLQPLHLLFTRAAQRVAVQLLRPSQSTALIADQRQILVFDTQTDADLEQIVRNVQADLKRVLLVGSAGIAQAVGKVCFAASAPTVRTPGARGQLLFIVGSRAQQSSEQVRRLLQRGAERFDAPNGAIGVDAVAKAKAPVLVVQASAGSGEADAVEVAARLAEGTEALLARGTIGVLVATGGDTAIAILQRLGRSTLRVIGTLLPGIPYSRIQGPAGELVFVTKAGGFGAPDAFEMIASRLRGAG
jgi:uncharacterized protein YgbK (DUF1537 family)